MRPKAELDHTFAVCAYKDSPYLEECVRSLSNQTVPANIILCTSTPSPYIEEIAGRYGIRVYVREGKSDIQDDWNFAYEKAQTRYVTLAHQDDIYEPDYLESFLAAVKKYPDISLYFTAYTAIRHGKPDPGERTCRVKRLLCSLVRFHRLASLGAVKKSCLCLGNSISCPMTTYDRMAAGERPFQSRLKFALDWEMYWKMAQRPGRFYYEPEPKGFFRIHEGATTSDFTASHMRSAEEAEMVSHFWPRPVVRLLMRFYSKSYSTYEGKTGEDKAGRNE